MIEDKSSANKPMLSLFQRCDIILKSGETSDFKIECDALGWEDWDCLAYLLAQRLPSFSTVYFVPNGGYRLMKALAPYQKTGSNLALVVDDVWTTGNSMRGTRELISNPNVIGAVVFARREVEPWVTALFHMGV